MYFSEDFILQYDEKYILMYLEIKKKIRTCNILILVIKNRDIKIKGVHGLPKNLTN